MPEWLDNLIKIITFVLAFYGVLSAVAAKRSALAAEKQASHAETQADAALTQAKAAEAQAEMMRSTMTVDRIGIALKGRRTVVEIKPLIRNADAEVKRARGSVEIHAAISQLRRATVELQDFPPVYPANVRAILFGFTQQLDAIDYATATRANGLPVADLDRAADTVIAAIDVAIGASISALKE